MYQQLYSRLKIMWWKNSTGWGWPMHVKMQRCDFLYSVCDIIYQVSESTKLKNIFSFPFFCPVNFNLNGQYFCTLLNVSIFVRSNRGVAEPDKNEKPPGWFYRCSTESNFEAVFLKPPLFWGKVLSPKFFPIFSSFRDMHCQSWISSRSVGGASWPWTLLIILLTAT